MNIDDTYIKTPKGIEEIEKRSLRLGARLRIALIQVDGHATVGALLAKIPGEGMNFLDELLSGGFIEKAAGGAKQQTAAPTASVTAAPLPAPVPADFNLVEAKRRASKAIEASFGPAGDSIAIDIERAKTPVEFAARAERVRDMIKQMRGLARAQEFWAATGL
ncbi:MAG: hypothetical protein ABL931_06990 [Usitatibacteraceae bacterium]